MLVCSIRSFLTLHACRRLQSGKARGEVVVDLGTESSHSVGKSMTREYATTDDLRKRSTGGISSLYLLSFLLTGNRKEAKQCFVAGLADCVDGNPAFKKWANSWARRIIVHNAIQIKSPHVSQPGLETSASRSANEYTLPKNALRYAPFTSVLALEDFEREHLADDADGLDHEDAALHDRQQLVFRHHGQCADHNSQSGRHRVGEWRHASFRASARRAEPVVVVVVVVVVVCVI